jgi:hypothetical protein
MRKVIPLLLIAAILCAACTDSLGERIDRYRADTSQYALTAQRLVTQAVLLTPPINWETPARVASTPWQDEVRALLIDFRALNKAVGAIDVPPGYQQSHELFALAVTNYGRALDQLELYATTTGKGADAVDALEAQYRLIREADGALTQWVDTMLAPTPAPD